MSNTITTQCTEIKLSTQVMTHRYRYLLPVVQILSVHVVQLNKSPTDHGLRRCARGGNLDRGSKFIPCTKTDAKHNYATDGDEV